MPQLDLTPPAGLSFITLPGLPSSGAVTIWGDWDYLTTFCQITVIVAQGTPDEWQIPVYYPVSFPGLEDSPPGTFGLSATVALGRPGLPVTIQVSAGGARKISVGYELLSAPTFATDWLTSDQYFSGDEYPSNDPQDWYPLNTFAGGGVGDSSLETVASVVVSSAATEEHENAGEDVSTFPTLRALADSGANGFVESSDVIGYGGRYYADGAASPPYSHADIHSGYSAVQLSVAALASSTYKAARRLLPLYWHQRSNGLKDAIKGVDGPFLDLDGLRQLERTNLTVEWEGVSPTAPYPHTADLRFQSDLQYKMQVTTFGVTGMGPTTDLPESTDLQVIDVTDIPDTIETLRTAWHTPAELSTYPIVDQRTAPPGAAIIADPTWHVIDPDVDLGVTNRAALLFITSAQTNNVEPPWSDIKADVDASFPETIKTVWMHAGTQNLVVAAAMHFPRYRVGYYAPTPIYPLTWSDDPPLRQRNRGDGRALSSVPRGRGSGSKQESIRGRAFY